MKCSLKYIILLFISTYLILNICLYDNEPFINFKIISDPNKAGSINELYLQGFNENIFKDENYSDDILDKSYYTNLFQKAEKKSYEEMRIPESSDYSRKLYRNDELKSEWFLLDAKKDFEKVLEVGYSINGYDVLPKHSDIDISRALRKEFLEDPESISELITLRLILFFELRYLNKKFPCFSIDCNNDIIIVSL